MPPERVPGATDYEYLNPDNLPVFPFNFEEGVIEQMPRRLRQ